MESTVDVIDAKVIEVSEAIKRTAQKCLVIKRFCIDNCKTGRDFINNYHKNELSEIVYGKRDEANDIKYAPEITAVECAITSLTFSLKDIRDTLIFFIEQHKEILDITLDLDVESENLDKANRFVRHELHALLDKIQICLSELKNDVYTKQELQQYINNACFQKTVYHAITLKYVEEMISRLSFIDASMCTLHKAMIDYLDSIGVSSNPLKEISDELVERLSEFSGGVN